MNPVRRRPDRYGVVMTLVIVLSVYTVNLQGVLRFADDYWSDLANAFAVRSYAPDDVLLVYTPQPTLDDDSGQLAEMVQRISQDQPSVIAIVHPISLQQQERLAALPCASKLIVGYELNRDQLGSSTATSGSLAQGYLDLCLDGQAVYRNHVFKRQRTGRQSTNDQTMLSIEAEIVKRIRGEDAVNAIPMRSVGVRFFGGVSGLPNVQSQEVIDGEIISEMVANRIVMIGPMVPNQLGFATPMTLGADRMSRLELHANLLQTLLHDNYLVSLHQLGIFGVLFCVPLMCVYTFRNLGNRCMLRSWLALLLIVCMICWSCLSIASLRMPITAMLLAVSLSFISVLYLRFRALRELVDNWRLIRSESEQHKSRSIDGDRWSAMADSVNEVFSPRRVVLLKLDPGSTHLEIAQTRGCEQDEIREQRRDVHRFPFRQAIEQNYPVQIENRQFLIDIDGGRGSEFMAPLVMLSEVIGLLVMEMDADALEHWGDFEACLARYSSDMAIFLAGNPDDGELTDATEFVRLPSRALPEQIIAASLIKNEIQHRSFSNMLGNAIDGAETAIAVGDIFGRLVKVNEKMIALMQREDASTQDTTCVEILAKLTERDEVACRKLFRRCIIEDHTEQIVLASKSADKSSSVLFVRPLSSIHQDQSRGVDARFIAIEIVSGEIFDSINHWQRQFLSAQSQRIDQQMELLMQIAGDLEVVKREGGSHADPFVAMARDVLQSVNECRAAAGSYLTDSPADHFLLDSQPILSAALRDCADDLTLRGITVCRSNQVTQSFASANPFLLEQVFGTIIDCLVTDCDEETELVIDCDQDDQTVHYRFSTQSSQIETTELERCLFGATESDRVMHSPSEDALVTERHLDRLRESHRWLQGWGASLTIDCDAFYRVSILLTLITSESNLAAPLNPVPQSSPIH